MNIALEKCQEFVNGQLRRTYGDAFVRGNNGEDFITFTITNQLIFYAVLYISSG